MAANTPEVNTTIAGRYRIVRLISRGFSADVFQVVDSQGATLVLKLQRKDAIFPEYTEHLRMLDGALPQLGINFVLTPIETGAYDNRYWEVFKFLSETKSLREILFVKRVLSPGVALDLVAKIAKALGELHSHQIIHGDVKPGNVLVDSATGDPTLIDFGMVKPVGTSKDIVVVGTYNYLPPQLRNKLPPAQSSSGAVSLKISVRAPVGPYIDVYALGVLTLEMLTSRTAAPDPLSTDHVVAILLGDNPALRSCESAVVQSIGTLVCRMLTVSSVKQGPSAAEVSTTAESLRKTFPMEEGDVALSQREAHAPDRKDSTTEVSIVRAVSDVLRDFARSSVEKTMGLILTSDKVVATEPREAESRQLGAISDAFKQASDRIRASWFFGLGMTICAFAVVIMMIICAVVFGIVTKSPGWPLVFGGASAASVLGTLMWKPYDRIFRATILASQIQMIQFQVQTMFESTTDLNKRLEVCREAVKSLGDTLSQEAMPKSESTAKAPKKAKR